MTDHTLSQKFGPVRLAEGVRPRHAAFFLFSAFLGISFTTFLSAFQPYLLSVHLDLPSDQMGRVSGLTLFAGECVLLVSSSLIGAWSDRIGRRGVFVFGVLILAAGWFVLAFVSTVSALVAARMFMTIGIAVINVMMGALMADYPAESSRGKLVALVGIAIGFGNIMIGVLFMRLPDIFVARGADALTAGRYTLFLVMGLSLLLALAVRIGIKGGRPPYSSAQEPFRRRLAMGVQAGKHNTRILLAYGSAFVARADLVVIGTFLNLWVIQAGIASGLAPDEAARKAGGIFAMVMTSALLWAPAMGWLNDRMDRVNALALAMLLAAVGYLGVAFVPDPLGFWMYPVGVVLGIGQISAVTASQTLIGQESPPAYRGSVVGMFSMFGALGILFVSSIGGWIFDAISPTAPFVLIGVVNALLFFAALKVAGSGRPALSVAAD